MFLNKYDSMFNVVINILGVLMICVVMAVLWFIVVASVSSPQLVAEGKVFLWPKGFTLDAYRVLMEQKDVWIGYLNSLFYAIAGTILSVLVTMLTAYPFSRRDFPARNWLVLFIMIPAYFSGGMIPTFLLIKALGMYNTIWALLLPSAVSMYNIIIARTFIQSNIPFEIQESAKIDGAGDFTILFRFIFPLSGPIIAVLVLFFALAQWNSYITPLIYLKDRSKYPLQLFLSEILVKNQQTAINALMTQDELEAAQRQADKAELLKYALVIVSSLPFMVLYPIMQKYVVKGIAIGSIKG